MPLFDAQERLYALVNLSLLSVEGEGRYRQHALLADFAGEQLGEALETRGRMARYFLAYATEHQLDYDALRPEWENLSAGIRVAHDLKMWHTVVDFTKVLREAWFARGRYGEARRAYQWAREATMALKDDRLLSVCLLHWGHACIEQNEYDEAEDLLSVCLALFRELDYPANEATALYQLARISLERAKYSGAERLLAESRRLREQLGDIVGVAETIYRQAWLRYQRSDYDEARQLATQALSMQESAKDKLGSIRTLRLSSNILLQLKEKDHDLAERHCQSALELCKELQDQGELAMVLLALSNVHWSQEKLFSARKYAEESLRVLQKLGDRRSQAQVHFKLSQINRTVGDYEEAQKAAYQSLEFCRQLKDDLGTAFVARLLGDLFYDLDQREKASEIWHRSLKLAEKLQHSQLLQSLQDRLSTEQPVLK
jgi:tetratricopeptide (TPR) repeat protein